jgi:hypothetical protein
LKLAARKCCIDLQFLVRGKGRPNGKTYFVILSEAPSGCEQQKTTNLHDSFHFLTFAVNLKIRLDARVEAYQARSRKPTGNIPLHSVSGARR